MSTSEPHVGAQSRVRIGHVGLNVSDLARAKIFYRTVFGFDVLRESQTEGRKYLFLGHGQQVVLTLWEQSRGRFDAHAPGLHHLAFQVDTVAELEEAERRLRGQNVRFHYDGIVPHAEGASSGGLFFEDPDGTRLEIFCPAGAGDRRAPVPDAPSCGFF